MMKMQSKRILGAIRRLIIIGVLGIVLLYSLEHWRWPALGSSGLIGIVLLYLLLCFARVNSSSRIRRDNEN